MPKEKSASVKRALWWVCAFVAVYIIAVVATFSWKLRALNVSTTDPAGWGQFGDYMGGMLNPMFALLNIIAVAYIAISLQRYNEDQRKKEQDSEERIKTVVDLHREWNSESTYRARTRAGQTVRDYASNTLLEIEDQTQPDEAAQIWIVVGFFLRLSFLVQHDRVQKEMVTELFGELFVWWWVVSFEQQLIPCDWDARDRIQSLKDWFYQNTTAERRAPWELRARRDLREAIQNEGIPPFAML